jgi:hypothetical protein
MLIRSLPYSDFFNGEVLQNFYLKNWKGIFCQQLLIFKEKIVINEKIKEKFVTFLHSFS